MDFWLKIAHAAWHGSADRGRQYCKHHPTCVVSSWLGYHWCAAGSHVLYLDDIEKIMEEPDFLKALHGEETSNGVQHQER
jgi:hypothetical protein